MNATLDAITSRYACRSYADTPVPPDTLHTIATAGLHAPSAVNRQPWQIVAVSDRAIIGELEQIGLAALKEWDAGAYERILGRGGKLLYNAPAIIVVAVKPVEGAFKADLDIGVVASHIVLAATSLGVNSCIVGLPLAAFAGSQGPALKQRFAFPEGYEFGIGILLGYAASGPGAPHEVDSAKLTELL
jgi:nitroreductase